MLIPSQRFVNLPAASSAPRPLRAFPATVPVQRLMRNNAVISKMIASPIFCNAAGSSSEAKAIICDCPKATASLIDALLKQPDAQKKLYVDFEGLPNREFVDGSIAIGQVLLPGSSTVYILDFLALPNVLEIKHNSTSLRKVLESRAWRKFMFDPRNEPSQGRVPGKCGSAFSCVTWRRKGARANTCIGFQDSPRLWSCTLPRKNSLLPW